MGESGDERRFRGGRPLASSRPDKDFDGAGVSIGLAVAGVLAAGLGLVTMHTAFKPLPKPGVAVVISHAETPIAQASWRHAKDVKPAARISSIPEVDEAPAHVRAVVRHDEAAPRDTTLSRAPDAASAAKPAPAAAPASLAAKLTVQQVANADVPGEKLCKAPTSQVLSAKALQPAMILRYDSKFKAPPLDIAPERPPSDDTERRIKLSALLSNMLEN